MVKKEEKRKSIILRKKGYSLNEISKKLELNKTTVSLWVRDIKLNDNARKRLEKRRLIRYKMSEETKRKIRATHKRLYAEGVLSPPNNRNSYHTKLEKEIKSKIETFFDTKNLLPEKINGIWFDFVNESFIIEYTINKTEGISNAIKRFKEIKMEKRKKFLVCPRKYFGIVRRKRLDEVGTTFINLDIIPNL